MLDTLCDHLAEIPGLYIDEMAISYGTSSTYDRRHPVSHVLFLGLDGPRRQLGRNP